MQKHIQRQLILISSDMIHKAFEDTTDVFDLLDEAESNLFQVSENNLRRSYDSMQDLVSKAIKEIQNAKNSDDKLHAELTDCVFIQRNLEARGNMDVQESLKIMEVIWGKDKMNNYVKNK